MFLDNHQNWGPGAGCGGKSSFGSIQNFLENIPSRVRMPTIPPFTSGPTTHHYRQKVFAGYYQDDWKFRSNLTFNLGLRYEFATIPTETQDKINQLEAIWQNPGTTCGADLQGLAVCPGFYHQTFQENPTRKDFEPRVGLASGIPSTPAKPPSAVASEYLTTCRFPTCLPSILCKRPPMAPKSIFRVALESRAAKGRTPLDSPRWLLVVRGLGIA